MLGKLNQFADDHPVVYLAGAGLLLFIAADYVRTALGAVDKYREIKSAAREVSEALGG